MIYDELIKIVFFIKTKYEKKHLLILRVYESLENKKNYIL